MITDKNTLVNNLDVVIHDETEKKALLIDVSIPINTNIIKKKGKYAQVHRSRDRATEILGPKKIET